MKFNNMEKDQLFIMHVVIDLIYMILGSFLISIGTNWFLLPYKMTTGGASGVATIFYYNNFYKYSSFYFFNNKTWNKV